ncbi:MAG: DUF1569 domain-containing protein [Ginsengibacter sp.]
MKSVFDPTDLTELLQRIDKLETISKPTWGKMEVAQMLAHCNVTYELVYDNKHPKPKGLKKWILKTFVKNIVVNEKPYKKNGRTAPEFLVSSDKNFDIEKKRLIDYIKKTQKLGDKYFENRESNSFGNLTIKEWNNMFYKHLDHHLNQFGV